MDRHNIGSSTTDPSRRTTPRRHRRAGHTVLLVVLLTCLSLMLAATASAARPTRTVSTPGDRVIPAGLGCAFDVAFDPDPTYRLARTEFSDGRVMLIGNGDVTLTNLETGASLAWQNDYQRTETYDAATNDLLIANSGRIALAYWPGDVDQHGQVVGENGAYYGFVGHLQAILDLDREAFTSATLRGWAIDLCAALSD